jgi:hypothetical protein
VRAQRQGRIAGVLAASDARRLALAGALRRRQLAAPDARRLTVASALRRGRLADA